ncbi:hypothetical protein BAY61_32210 (plasmid) [Prauserella marina]|uniref:Uncharacterized protein n=1 Tax=Prauserella marina TaxID=530584 RepID=A0A222W164_9PSEU|nr:hypothetical protein [Prauserella marina]ASR39948.1 hypothetical protein BAY61_32210 [Prauserella marina]PWV71451.1 hypothetical protein DES30_112167 [Prauserella marina]SDD97382.1 hypothetical protein SAMN05421630_115112 [Prauserella marina]
MNSTDPQTHDTDHPATDTALLQLPPGIVDPTTAWEIYRRRPRPAWWGWPVRHGGRSANVEAGTLFQGTTTQVCGLFPFASGSGSAPRGVPVGRHMFTAEPVGIDIGEWLRTGQISNSGVWVQGQPGIGKSAIVKRLALGMAAFGNTVVIPGDVKGEYSPLVELLDGRVFRIGRGSGLHAINPLDGGPLRGALAQASTADVRTDLAEKLRARQISLLEALIVIVRRTPMTVTERVVLGRAIDAALTAAAPAAPVIPDVLRVLRNAPADLLEAAHCADAREFGRDQRDLINSLHLIVDGAIKGMFDRPSTVTVDPDISALSLDLSELADEDDAVIAAAMLCSWSWSAAMIDAARASAHARNVLLIQDELWRALRVAPGLVEHADQLTRLNRHRGVVQIQVTHSLDDLNALPTEEDRAKARGMAGRANVMLLGGSTLADITALGDIVRISSREAQLVASWSAPETWATGGQHPGRGRYLIKSGQRIGLPVEMPLTPTERDLFNTDTAWLRDRR